MIRVNTSKVKIVFTPGWNDMGAYFPSEYEVRGEWVYMSMVDYVQKREFERFDMKPKLSQDEMERLKTRLLNKDFNDSSFIHGPWEAELKRMIELAGGYTVWQYNVINQTADGYVRLCSALGEPRLRRIGTLERVIKLPVFKLVCRFLNYLHRSKQIKEVTEWKKWKETVLSKVR